MIDFTMTAGLSAAYLGGVAHPLGLSSPPGFAQVQFLTQLVITLLRQQVFGPDSSRGGMGRRIVVCLLTLGGTWVTLSLFFPNVYKIFTLVDVLLRVGVLGGIQVGAYVIAPRVLSLLRKYVPGLASHMSGIYQDLLEETEQALKRVQKQIRETQKQIEEADTAEEKEHLQFELCKVQVKELILKEVVQTLRKEVPAADSHNMTVAAIVDIAQKMKVVPL